ncbi:MAG TPA: hypothetical protein DIW81_14880 [Planctomycetaceae bacterium]|nr:hypothetical protein [Rubinisphaera sp.]HCS52853.1 hypothetical protein [Planctomycetaceae bacterium]
MTLTIVDSIQILPLVDNDDVRHITPDSGDALKEKNSSSSPLQHETEIQIDDSDQCRLSLHMCPCWFRELIIVASDD